MILMLADFIYFLFFRFFLEAARLLDNDINASYNVCEIHN